MKITESVQHECCHPSRDLKPYKGNFFAEWDALTIKNLMLSFCEHCGQLWIWDRAPGEMDAGWERVK